METLRKADQDNVCPHRAKRDGLAINFPGTKILPRFLIEGWGMDGYQALFSADSPLAKKFIDMLLSTVTQFSFDGLVLDAGYLNMRAPWRPHLISVLKSLAKALHEKDLLFVLVIPVRSIRRYQEVFMREMFLVYAADINILFISAIQRWNSQRIIFQCPGLC